AVILKRRDPVGMAEHRCQIRSVGSEPGFRARPVAKIHSALLDGSNLHSCHTATASQQGRNQAAGPLGLRLSRTNYYDDYAREFPVLARLKELAKITAAAKFFVRSGIQPDLSSLFLVSPVPVATPATTPGISVRSPNTISTR